MEKFILVLFGASGDLAWRKLMPALYTLHQQKLLPETFKVLGVGRMAMTDETFRAKTIDGLSQFVPKANIPMRTHAISLRTYIFKVWTRAKSMIMRNSKRALKPYRTVWHVKLTTFFTTLHRL